MCGGWSYYSESTIKLYFLVKLNQIQQNKQTIWYYNVIYFKHKQQKICFTHIKPRRFIILSLGWYITKISGSNPLFSIYNTQTCTNKCCISIHVLNIFHNQFLLLKLAGFLFMFIINIMEMFMYAFPEYLISYY